MTSVCRSVRIQVSPLASLISVIVLTAADSSSDLSARTRETRLSHCLQNAYCCVINGTASLPRCKGHRRSLAGGLTAHWLPCSLRGADWPASRTAGSGGYTTVIPEAGHWVCISGPSCYLEYRQQLRQISFLVLKLIRVPCQYSF